MSHDVAKVSLWLVRPRAFVAAALFGCAVGLLVVENTDWMARHEAVVVPTGLAAVLAIAWTVNWPQRLTFDGDRLVRKAWLRPAEVLPINEITKVEGYYMVKAGPKIAIMGQDPRLAVDLAPAGAAEKLPLHGLGRRLQQLDMTKVIADETARRALGIPGRGLRDPWTQ